MNRQIFNTAPDWRATLARRSLRSLILPALFVICAQAQAQNATGEPGVTAADSANLTMVGPNEDSQLTAARGSIMDADSITTFTPAWAWQEADAPASGAPMDNAYSAIAGATAATFTPLQAHVGKFIRVCATFDDDGGNSETRCWTSVAAVVNVNDAPVGLPNTIYVPAGGNYTFSVADFPFIDEDGDSLIIAGVGTPTKGTFTFNGNPFTTANSDFTLARLTGAVGYRPPADAGPMSGYATFEWAPTTRDITAGNLDRTTVLITIDLVSATASAAMGAPTVTAATGIAYHEGVELTASTGTVSDANGIPTHTRIWQWQQSAAQAGTYADIPGAADVTFTPLQARVGRYIRVCLRFTDGIDDDEGGTAASPTLCSAGAVIARTNSVSVPTAAGESGPYEFKPSDFMFPGDVGNLQSVTIRTAIASDKGILRNGATAVTAGATVTAAALRNGDLTFYPAGRFAATPNYASFTFTVNYGGGINTGIRTMHIHLVEHLRLRLRLFLEGPLR